MNADERVDWLTPSPPIAVDGDEPRGRSQPAHTIRLRDKRARFGDEEAFVAECTCGWIGPLELGRTSRTAARHEGLRHIDEQRPPRLPKLNRD